jgi:quinoprotein glucose dehydrogenase
MTRSYLVFRTAARLVLICGGGMRFLFPVAALATLATAILASAQGETRTVQAGVFTKEQADRGASTFENRCKACHQPDEFGDGLYLESWSGQTMGDMIEKIRTTMPEDSPGSLARSEYVDVGAFLLELNGLPKGESEMDSSSIKEIRIEGPFGPRRD